MYIAQNNSFVVSIALPEKPSKTEFFAKDELVKYLSQIVGCAELFPNNSDFKIHIGSLKDDFNTDDVNAKKLIRESMISDEGFLILSTDKELFLVGADSSRAGIIYSVYELLERYLGLSLSAYGRGGSDVGELIPHCDTLLIEPTLYVKKNADIAYRAAIVQYDNWLGNPDHKLNESFISWLAKNRYNRILTWCGIYEGYKKNGMLSEAEKRGISFSVGHHEAFNTFLPAFGNEYFPERYRETHPEYYKLLESGERYTFREGDYSEQFTLCMRNEEMIAEFSKNAVSWLLQNPAVDVICLWPQDGDYPQCACDRCSRHSKSDNYTYFVSAVSAEISRSLPYIKIDRIAYMDLTEAPSEQVSPSLIADVSVWLNTGLRHVGGCNGESFIGSPAEKIVTSWKDKGALSVYYDYLMGIYAERQRWMPIASEIPSLVRRMKDEGIYGLGTQIEPFNLWNNIVNFYTYGRCAYDASLTFQDSLSRFCRIFGKASGKMKEIIEYAETILDGSVTLDLASEHFIRNADREYMYRAFDEALALADTPRSRNNVRLMRMVFRYSDLEIFSPRYGEKTPEKISDAVDPCGELWYMRENFDSYVSGNEGYGVAFPVWFKPNGNYLPDEWYDFEGE